jgi:L-fuconate dehydratase
MWDYVALSGTKEGRMIEFVDQQHEQFKHPARINNNANYIAPDAPGYSTELREEAIENYEYPNGSEWQKLFEAGIFTQKVN